MKLQRKISDVYVEVTLPGSKSESNRALIINKLSGNSLDKITNLSEAEDTNVLKAILSSQKSVLNVGHAGTAMRFLTAYFASQNREVKLKGSSRMNERPIGLLVDALNSIGANIFYLNKQGYPPLHIKGKELLGSYVQLNASISSQYLSALLMISPYLKRGLKISVEGEMVSAPYVDMTIKLMAYYGVKVEKTSNTYSIPQQAYKAKSYTVESDWSAASYWYEIVCLSEELEVQLNGLRKGSLQGDSALVQLYKKLGVSTEWNDRGIVLKKDRTYTLDKDSTLAFNLIETPDLAQALICTCAGLGVKAKFTGLSTLKIKETDRLLALQNELSKMGRKLDVGIDSATLVDANDLYVPTSAIETYKDHRMAMAFAPLALKVKQLEINNPEVVKKSYPNFWKDLRTVFDVVN